MTDNRPQGVASTTNKWGERTTVNTRAARNNSRMTKLIGLWCMRRRWLVVGVWVVIIAGGSFAIGPLFAQMGDTTVLTGTETGDAQEAIDNGIERGVEFYAVVDNI